MLWAARARHWRYLRVYECSGKARGRENLPRAKKINKGEREAFRRFLFTNPWEQPGSETGTGNPVNLRRDWAR